MTQGADKVQGNLLDGLNYRARFTAREYATTRNEI